jgi:large subunit ribosomal protein L22
MDLVRGRTVNQALDTLDNDRHRAARSIAKVLRSAVANALQNPEVRANRLVVSEAFCNEGPLLQNRMRFRPSAMGRALPFRRRTCHIHIKIKDPEVQVGTAADQTSVEETVTATSEDQE